MAEPEKRARPDEELAGLGGEWEHSRTIRDRVRLSGSLFDSEVGGKVLEININGAVAHHEVLKPLLMRLAGRPDLSMVSIPALEHESLSENESFHAGSIWIFLV